MTNPESRMNAPSPPITIVGCGPGSPETITLAALRAIENASVVVGAPRLLDCFAPPGAARIPVGVDIATVLDSIAQHLPHGPVVILVTGDPGISSLAAPVLRRFGRRTCKIIPGVSAIQEAFARLGLEWLDARLISAHGRAPAVSAEELARHEKIAVLAGTQAALTWAAQTAAALPDHEIYACRDLSLPSEHIHLINAVAIRKIPASGRTIIIFVKKGIPS